MEESFRIRLCHGDDLRIRFFEEVVGGYLVGGRLRRPFWGGAFSAPRLRLVAELKLFCRCTAFFSTPFRGGAFSAPRLSLRGGA